MRHREAYIHSMLPNANWSALCTTTTYRAQVQDFREAPAQWKTGVELYYQARLLGDHSTPRSHARHTSSAGVSTTQDPSGMPYKHKFSLFGSQASKSLSDSLVSALTMPLRLLYQSLKMSSAVRIVGYVMAMTVVFV